MAADAQHLSLRQSQLVMMAFIHMLNILIVPDGHPVRDSDSTTYAPYQGQSFFRKVQLRNPSSLSLRYLAGFRNGQPHLLVRRHDSRLGGSGECLSDFADLLGDLSSLRRGDTLLIQKAKSSRL